MIYQKNLTKEKILKIYNYAIKKRKENLGQRSISRKIKEKFSKTISEGTISNWIYKNRIPFGNEKTQFKPLKKPSKNQLIYLYEKQKKSAQEIAKYFQVSAIIVINWLKYYHISVRTHKDSMNTHLIKSVLRERKLKKPTKEFSVLSAEKAYMIGVLCGDGYINKKFIRFEIKKDEEFIKEFSRCLNEVYGIEYKYNYYRKRDSLVLYASNEIICSDLLRYCKFKTFEWYIPKEIINCKDKKTQSMFLRGLFDSEGSSSKYNISMSSANKEGIEQVSELLKKLEIENKISKIRSKYYQLYITKRERLKKFRDEIGFTIKRKMEPLNNLK